VHFGLPMPTSTLLLRPFDVTQHLFSVIPFALSTTKSRHLFQLPHYFNLLSKLATAVAVRPVVALHIASVVR